MNVATAKSAQKQAVEHFDVLVVGAGISGIDAAHYLQTEHPGKSFVLLETQESFGGTWLTHKYPGIRSDSDLFTFGYKWKPWMGAPIATADEILKYLDEVLDEEDIRRHIRYQVKVTDATWSSEEKLWTVQAQRTDTGETLVFTTNFMWMCQGYYHHDKGYTPEWEDMDKYEGQIVHPQTWPEDLDYKDTWSVGVGTQYKFAPKWMASTGISYDSAMLDEGDATPAMPVGDSWRWGIGLQHEYSKKTTIGLSYELIYNGDIKVDQERGALSGRIAGKYKDAMIHVFGASLTHRF